MMFTVFVILCEKPHAELPPFLEIGFVAFSCTLLESPKGVIPVVLQLFSVTSGDSDEFGVSFEY